MPHATPLVVVALATMVGDHETVVTARVVARAAFAMRDLDSTIAHLFGPRCRGRVAVRGAPSTTTSRSP